MLVDGDWGELREQIGHQEGYMGWLVGWAFLSVLSFFFSSLLFFFSFLFLFFLPLCCCFEVSYNHMASPCLAL
jgi:hypothetical protein